MLRISVLLCAALTIGASLGNSVPFYNDDDEFSGASSNLQTNLQEQIKALVEHRKQLDKELDTIKIANQIELTALREEIESLRKEITSAKESSGPQSTSNNQQRNDHLTVQWLQSAVQQIRSEIQTELSASHNTSEIHSQSVSSLSSEVSLLRGDVDSCRADLEALRRDAELNTVQNQQNVEEIGNIREKAQSCSASCANLRVQLETAQSEWSSVLKPAPVQSKISTNNENRADSSSSVTEHMPKDYERRLRRVEKHLKTAMWSHAKSASREAEQKELLERVSQLESSSRTNARKFFNISRDLAAIDKVQKSNAQLKEQVTLLENRLDTSIPELQKEVTKMEFELAQTSSNAQVAKDSQEVQSKSLKNLMDLVSGLQDGLDENRALISVLKHGALSSSASSLLDEQQNDEESAAADKSVKRVVRDISRIEKDFLHILHTLPQDCEAISGQSGQYLIAPKLAPEELDSSNVIDAQFEAPILASCDQKSGAGGWTVIQRRTEGTEEFNRDWAEYRAGFGSPGGEFWLGNQAIRRLTADNCSSLRVDIHDIYGQNWFAEYTEFSVGTEQDGYRLWVNGYQGNASDAFEYQNHMQFSTIDSDRDISNTHCAANYEGGWWFSHCQHVNLNGRYSLGLTWFDSTRNEWIAVAWSEMKVRRRAGCAANKQQHQQQ
ncbi:Hypothetical predicted protein [Cloeon dipterum]|uniref:Fibrinogen C-terminal domain-containing protein n=1 Tax=Cloeon dipterum TaxID=197152 RepID=A0A8S1CFH0_9INSE|nr:Hypothetical predicted protein [Cloeon dipterum]